MTGQVLGVDDDAVLEKLQARLADDEDPEVTHELLQVDEAATFLHPSDEQALAKEQANARQQREESSEFKRELATARAEVRAKERAARKTSGVRTAARPRLPPPSGLVDDHAMAKRLSPPGSYVWRAFAHGAWEGRIPPRKTIVERWRDQSPAEAMHKLLVALWKQYIEMQGIPPKQCPMLGACD